MQKNLSTKNKFYLFLLGLFIAFIVTYQLAIKNTIMIARDNAEKQQQLENVSNNSLQLEELEKRLNSFNSQVNKGKIDKNDIRQEILNFCSNFCNANSLSIKDYPGEETFNVGNSTIQINRISIDGQFHNVLRLINSLEQEKMFGNVISVHFKKEKENYLQKEYLLTTIFFQYINSEKQ